jgi:hypothetical protein
VFGRRAAVTAAAAAVIVAGAATAAAIVLSASAEPAAPSCAAAGAPAQPAPGWRIVCPLPPGTTVTGIDAISASDAWAIGSPQVTPAMLVWHWNGARWLPVPAPDPVPPGPAVPGGPSRCSADALAVSPDGTVWVFGARSDLMDPAGCILRWNGRDWVTEPGWAQSVAAVSPGPGDLWVFAGDFPVAGPLNAAHFDGAGWSSMKLQVDPGTDSVSALTPSDIWLEGSALSPGTASGFVVMRWNGRSWAAVRLPALRLPEGDTSTFLGVVTAVTPDSVWVAGVATDDAGRSDAIVLLHWNGAGWQQLASPRGLIPAEFDGSLDLGGGLNMAPDGSGGLWLTVTPADGGRTVVVHYTGGRWYRIPAPAGLGTLAAIPGTTSVWGSASGGIAEYSP